MLPVPQSSASVPQLGPGDVVAASELLSWIENQGATIAKLRESVALLQGRYDELESQHGALWGIVGELTTEAIELESKLAIYEAGS